ncbi:MAG: hypothetical protein K8F30_04510 [Taibaiella sp.]|nr:hypothetical protein [Taibaiella sp.]
MIRKGVLILIVLVTAVYCKAQKMAEDYYHYSDGKKYDTIGVLTNGALQDLKYLVTHHQRSKYCVEAYYEMGNYYQSKGLEKDALIAYRAVLERFEKYMNKDSTLHAYSPIPYASLRLVDIYEKAANYDSALYFLYIYDTVFNLFYGCGTGLEYEKANRIARISRLHESNHQVRDAERVLMAHLSYSGEAEDLVIGDQILGTLRELFRKYEDAAQLKAGIEAAISNYWIDTFYYKGRSGVDTLIFGFINFMDVKIGHHFRSSYSGGTVIDNAHEAGVVDRKTTIAYLKKSELYKMIQAL